MRFKENHKYELIDSEAERLHRRITAGRNTREDRIRWQEIIADRGYVKYIQRRNEVRQQQAKNHNQIFFDLGE